MKKISFTLPVRKGVAVALFVLLAVGGIAGAPRQATASLPVIDPFNLIQNTLNAANSVRQDLMTYVLKPLFFATINTVIDSIQQSTLEWVRSGFDGSPAFVTDLNRNLRNLGDSVTDDFYRQLVQQGSVKSPFLTRIALKVRENYYRGTSGNPFENLDLYSLADTCSSYQEFLSGEFKACGLTGWISAVRNPWNNPIGAQVSAEQVLAARLASAVTNRAQEIELGSGFLSKRKCAPATTGGVPEPVTGVSLSSGEKGYNCKIVTPGAVIVEQFNKSTGLKLDRLVSANDIDEILSTLAANLISKGLDNLLDDSDKGSGNPTISPTLTTNFLYAIEQQIRGVERYRNNWQKILSVANQASSRLAACEDNAKQSDIDAIAAIIAEAETAIEKAAGATAALNEFRSRAIAAKNQSQFQQLSTEYQALLSSGTMPTASEFAYATEQSQNTTVDGEETLVAKAVRISNQRLCGIFNNG